MTTKTYYIYILSNWTGSVLYIGVTGNPERRVYEHKNHVLDGFTKKYKVEKLVYIEQCPDATSAIAREKQVKGWRRDKKVKLIEGMNPDWVDLSEQWHKNSLSS